MGQSRRIRSRTDRSLCVPRAVMVMLAGLIALSSCGDWVPIGPLAQCGERCEPQRVMQCGGADYQYNRFGDCVCAEDAVCRTSPCGQICSEGGGAGCPIFRKYDARGECVCGQVSCPGCEGEPCCGQPCGSACSIKDCVDDGKGSCAGECSETGECHPEPAICGQIG